MIIVLFRVNQSAICAGMTYDLLTLSLCVISVAAELLRMKSASTLSPIQYDKDKQHSMFPLSYLLTCRLSSSYSSSYCMFFLVAVMLVQLNADK